MKLAKRSVDALNIADKAFIAWDMVLGGFGVKVSPSGRKAHVVQYRISGQSRKTRRMTLGHMARYLASKRELGLKTYSQKPPLEIIHCVKKMK